MPDDFSVEIDDSAVIARFDGLPRDVMDALERKCSALALALEAKIKGKLSGEVLNVRSGALRRSIFTDVHVEGGTVQAVAASSGDVPYAGIHEFGYVGPEHVRAHIREITTVFGRELKDPIMAHVRPFERQMNMPERSYLRSSLAEMSDEIVQGLQDTVNEELGR